MAGPAAPLEFLLGETAVAEEMPVVNTPAAEMGMLNCCESCIASDAPLDDGAAGAQMLLPPATRVDGKATLLRGVWRDTEPRADPGVLIALPL